MKKGFFTIAFLVLTILSAYSQNTYLITSNSVGHIKLGMTIAQARRAMHGFKLKRIIGSEPAALIGVSKAGRVIMTLYAGEEDEKKRIMEKAKIEQIFVWDSHYRTANGVRPNMSVRDAERLLGKVKRVFMSEIESREYVEFQKKPKSLLFRVGVNTLGNYLHAGVYPGGKREGTRCSPHAFIVGIEVSHYFD